MRGFGTIFRQKGSRFLWMQYWHNGERHRESTGCEKPKEAKFILRRRLADLDRSSVAIPSGTPRILVGDLYESLERDYVINGRKSLEDLKIRWRKHIEKSFADLPIASVTADELGSYIARRQREEASNATINRELAALKRMYKLAVTSGRLKFGQQPYFPMLQERNVRKGFVKDAQYAELAAATGKIGVWLRALFELGYTYGWRKGELLALKVGQVDMSERTVRLNAGETKNDEGRLVEMTAKIFELMVNLVAGKGSEDYVFTRGAHKTAVRTFRGAWRRATEAAGCPGLLFHDLRRSGVRNLLRAGVSEKVAMTISGHKTREVFERYHIVSQTDIHEAVGRLENAAALRRQRALFEQSELGFQEASETPRKPS